MKEVFVYLKNKQWHRARIHLEALCIYYKIKTIRRINKIYRKIWPFIFAFWVLVVLTWGTLMFLHDYNLLHNCANLDAPFSDYYTKWNIYGKPGQNPPR